MAIFKKKIKYCFTQIVGITLFLNIGCSLNGQNDDNTVKELQTQMEEQKALLEAMKNGHPVVKIPAGTFMMGCTPEQEEYCDDDEKPAHKVEITKDFYLMESEVTQGIYEKVMGKGKLSNRRNGSDLPVDSITWLDAVKFANVLSQKENLEQCYLISGENVSWPNKNCNGWRLPTEAEWEYAARGGQNYKYAGSDKTSDIAWNKSNSRNTTHEPCAKQKNGYGLCDMSGNVWEWVWDWKGDIYGEYAAQGTVIDPYGADSGYSRVKRGGSWSQGVSTFRVSNRSVPIIITDYKGFRLGRTL